MNKLITKINSDPFNVVESLDESELESVITYTSNKYYNDNDPVISDNIFDLLVDFLKLKHPKSKLLKKVGSRVKKDKVNLPYFMDSMDKIKPPDPSLDKWKVIHKAPYILSDKLDGMSGLLVYDKDIKLYSRGDSSEGRDITHLLKYLQNIPNRETIIKLFGNIRVAFRGELIMKKKTFENNWSKEYKNVRNLLPGIIGSKYQNPHIASDMDFVLYSVVDPFDNMLKQFEILCKLKFNVVSYKIVDDIDYESLSKYLKKRRVDGEYDIDGIIVTNNDKFIRNQTQKYPDYAFAFKDVLEDQIGTSTVIGIEWNITKDGYMKPVILIEKTPVGGIEISRITGNNAKFIVDNKLGKGAVIQVIRSNDVIPKVHKVVKPSKNVKLYEGEYEWTNSGVDIISKEQTTNISLKKIAFFFSVLNAPSLGEGNIKRIIDSGLNTVPKILKATKADLLKVEGFKEKTATNILESIKNSTQNIDMAVLMKASSKFGRGIGKEKSKMVISTYPDFMELDYSKTKWIELLTSVDGFDVITATQFATNLPQFKKFYEKIKTSVKIKKQEKTSDKLLNMTFVFSGFRDSGLQELIEKQGGKVGNSISKNTNYVIVKDKTKITIKIEKAQELGINIKSKDEIMKMVI